MLANCDIYLSNAGDGEANFLVILLQAQLDRKIE